VLGGGALHPHDVVKEEVGAVRRCEPLKRDPWTVYEYGA